MQSQKMERIELLTAIVDALKQEKNICLKAKLFDRLSGPDGLNKRLKEAQFRLATAKQ